MARQTRIRRDYGVSSASNTPSVTYRVGMIKVGRHIWHDPHRCDTLRGSQRTYLLVIINLPVSLHMLPVRKGVGMGHAVTVNSRGYDIAVAGVC